MGKTLKQYELGSACPPMAAVVKFESKAKALEIYNSDTYQDLIKKLGVGKSLFRDLRVIEGPSDLFIKGKAYWIALLSNIIDKDKFDKYFAAFMTRNEAGFEVKLEDGSTAKVQLTIKSVGPSVCFEEGMKEVPPAGQGADFFPGANTESGLVVVAEFDNHEVGAKFKECADYRNALLSSLGKEFTDEETYKAAEQEFTETVFKRDVRIIGIPA